MTKDMIIFCAVNLVPVPLFVGAGLLLLAIVCIRKPTLPPDHLKKLDRP